MRLFSTNSEAKRRLPRILRFVGGSTLALSGCGLYYAYREDMIPFISPLPLQQIDEKGFESADDLVVVLLGSRKRSQYPKVQIENLKSILPKGIRLYYTVKDGSDNCKPSLMLYKGMRKQFYGNTDLTDKSQCDNLAAEMATFFKPLSQDYTTLKQDPNIPEYVTYDTFHEKVTKEAKPNGPIVVQLYEESCFLCFLMRPFINSINRHLKDIKSPVRIKRLNIERNDFPKGCHVTRATPTFILYDGEPRGTRWSEFKPQEFVTKIVEVAKLNPKSQTYLESLSEDISRRFMLFGRWAKWMAQSQTIQESVLTKRQVDRDAVYSRAIKILMDLDMGKTDDLETNLKYLECEINSAEQDCIAIAQIQAREIIRVEGRRNTITKPQQCSNS
ncbi:hypothetical protein X943_003706 [Babesia divergens]|uniref:Thioredoxin domain-containing protein n=1 Tax=Babesia divergens TaxID=32595 RepID=A0AAD9GKR4_BABDI|nr:hypothetical protein X943_003706 [Babesia divergens]